MPDAPPNPPQNGEKRPNWRLGRDLTVDFAYDLVFTQDVLGPDSDILAGLIDLSEAPARLLTVIDGGVSEARPDLAGRIRDFADRHRGLLRLVCDPVIVPGGEAAKNDWQVFHRLTELINTHGICRHSYVLCIGGGAVLDAVGFATATAHRGVRLIRMPTTTLAQADAGLGVKNGINAFGKKNFLGVFAPPWAIINDTDFLATLDDRDWRCGLSEIIKVALIKDATLFERTEELADRLAQRDEAALTPLLRRSAELHARHILDGGDAFEMTRARPLDFGHWAAHKLEQMTTFELRHGEAVAIGVAIDTLYSARTGLLPASEADRVVGLLARLGFDLDHQVLADSDALLEGLAEFREHLGGRLTIPLLRGIGEAVDANEIDGETVRAVIDALHQSQAHATSPRTLSAE